MIFLKILHGKLLNQIEIKVHLYLYHQDILIQKDQKIKSQKDLNYL